MATEGRMERAMSWLIAMCLNALAAVFGITTLALLWAWEPQYIVWLLDFNLAMLKELTHVLDVQAGSAVEAALRALGIEHYLIVAEFTLAFKLFWLCIRPRSVL